MATGEMVHQIAVPDGTFTVAWHPQKHLLAFAGDEKDGNGRYFILFPRPLLTLMQ